MISSAMRWFLKLDRSYFFAISAFFASLLASLVLVFAPVDTRFDGSAVTLVENEGGAVIIMLVLPVLVLASPLIALPQKPGPRSRNDKINSFAATGVILAFVIAFLAWIGMFYMPALMMSIASTVSLYFGRNRVPVTESPDSGGGMRLSKQAKRRSSENRSGSRSGSKRRRRRR